MILCVGVGFGHVNGVHAPWGAAEIPQGLFDTLSIRTTLDVGLVPIFIISCTHDRYEPSN